MLITCPQVQYFLIFLKLLIVLFMPTCFSSTNGYYGFFVVFTYFLLIWKSDLKWCIYSTSKICYTNYGVPRDSALGPLFFLIYINDISDNIQTSISLFVNDATWYFSSKFPSQLHQVLSEYLITLAKWPDTWGVSFNFNAHETKVLTIFSNRGE